MFFDELGTPWPIHDCDTSWTRHLKRTTDKTGKTTVQLRDGITAIRPSIQIDDATINRVRRAKQTQEPDPFIKIDPGCNSTPPIVGILREINRRTCPFSKYNLGITPVGRAMLGPLGKQQMGRITVHVPLPEETQAQSFTLWIPTALIENAQITTGLTVSLTLESVEVHKHGYVWFSDEFEVVG